MKKFYSLLLVFVALFCQLLPAQNLEPIKWSQELKKLSDTDFEIVFSATIEAGWHLYSTDIPEGGPVSTTFNVDEISGLELVGGLTPRGKLVTVYEDVFGMDLSFFEGKGQFVQKLRATAADYKIVGYLNYMCCNDQNCLPPTNIEFTYTGKTKLASAPVAKTDEAEMEDEPVKNVVVEMPSADSPDETSETDTLSATTTEVKPAQDANSDWAPVLDELAAYEDGNADAMDMSLIYVFIAGFVGGLLALVTPCVWPIIPMTVSFFLKRSQDKKKGIRDAFIYGVSIIVIYVALGLIVTSIFGASALNELRGFGSYRDIDIRRECVE